MRIFQHIVSFLLIFSVPTMAVPQLPENSVCFAYTEENEDLEDVFFPNYDEMIAYIERVETEDLEKICNPQDLERLNTFLTHLAKVGSLSENGENATELYADIEDLLSEEIPYDFAYSKNGTIAIPAIFWGHECQTTICKSWVKKTCHKIKKFVKKHKKEIVIGAAVVVAAAVVVVAVVAVSSAGTAAAAAAGTAGAAASASSGSETRSSSASDTEFSNSPTKDESSSFTDRNDPLIMKTTIDEHVSSFKECFTDDNLSQQAAFSDGWDNLSFKEKARELGAHLAHQAYEDLSELVRVVPQLYEEVKEIGSILLPESLFPHGETISGNPMENYKNLVALGHTTIDNVFSTDQAEFFTTESSVNNLINGFAIGIIPLPGMISSNGSINVEEFSKLGKAADRAGFTKAGRGLMKHGYREGSIFPKPVGTPLEVNQHGQKVLESILNHPEKKVIQYKHKLHGPVIEIEAPQLGGIRFNGDGTEMIGFLEPRSYINGK